MRSEHRHGGNEQRHALPLPRSGISLRETTPLVQEGLVFIPYLSRSANVNSAERYFLLKICYTFIKEAKLNLQEIGSPDVIELSKAYIRVRYPDLNKQHYRTKERAQPLVDVAKEVFIWIKNKFNTR